MPSDARERMIRGAAELLARQGLQATSFSEVLEHTGAPRGSVYHHFPDGKDQMVGEAVDLAGAYLLVLLDHVTGAPADQVTAHFLGIWRSILTTSDLQAGCAVVAVTVATDATELISHASAVFRSWRERLSALLKQGGLSSRAAKRFAVTLIASAEGAVVISRAEQSIEPFDLVAEQLRDQVKRMLAD